MADKMATREAYGKALVELGKKYDNLVVMDADLSGSTKTALVWQRNIPKDFSIWVLQSRICMRLRQVLQYRAKSCAQAHLQCLRQAEPLRLYATPLDIRHANVKICATHAGITVGEDGASSSDI